MPFSLKRVMAKHKGRIFEKWIFDAHSPLLSNAAVADLNGDGHMEVVFGTKDGTLYCLDGEAQQLWVYQPNEGKMKAGDEYFYNLERLHAISSAPAIADITGDGKQEIIFGSDDGTVHALDHSGHLLWKTHIGGSIRATPKIADVNDDHRQEIIVTSTNKKLVILDHKGKKLLEFEAPSMIESTPGVLAAKGKPALIVFGLDNGEIHAIDAHQKQHWTFKTKGKVTAEPAFIEAREPMTIIGSWDGTLYAINLDGELVWKYKTLGAIYNKAVIADVNKDGRKEIVFGSCDNNVHTLTAQGERLWSYETDFWIVASPVAIDIDQDGLIEVVAGSFDNRVYVLEGAGSYELEYVPGLSGIVHQAGHYSDVMSHEPGERQGKRIWQYKTQGMVVGCEMLPGPAHPQLVVNVKSGFVDTLMHKG